MKTRLAIGALALLVAGPAWAQSAAPGAPARGAPAVQSQPNPTGNDPNLVVPRGATGAETLTTNSAAGGTRPCRGFLFPPGTPTAGAPR